MLSYTILRRMSTLTKTRYYNNAFEWMDDKWNLQAVIQPPQVYLEDSNIKLGIQSSLNFIICLKSEKYQKGRTIESYYIRMQDAMKLSLWKPTMPMLSFISTNKIVSFEKQDNTSSNILVSFYDKNLPEEQKRKEMIIPTAQFQFFLDTLNSGVEELTNGNQNKLSYIHELIKTFPPVASVSSRGK